MNTDNTTSKRAQLLNMAAGGDGHTAPWIEATPDGAAVLHIPAVLHGGKPAKGAQIHASMEACRGLLHALETGAQPKAPAGEENGGSRRCPQQ